MRIALICLLFSSVALAGYTEYKIVSVSIDSRGTTEKVEEVTELNFPIFWLN